MRHFLILGIAAILLAAPTASGADYGGGSGTAEDPYQIWDANDLNEIGLHEEDWHKDFKLMDDIDMSAIGGRDYHVIGTRDRAFRGEFDGNFKTISNFSYEAGDEEYVGLFGHYGGYSVKNVRLVSAHVTASGGSQWDVGGLVGNLSWGRVSNCSITDSFVTHEGMGSVGGLVGANYSILTHCYSVGASSGTSPVGGLVGDNWGGVVTDCFWDVEESGFNNMCGNEHNGGTGCDDSYGKTTMEMKTHTTFTLCDWDFVGEVVNGSDDVWRMCVDGESYPKLWWEFGEGDFLCPDGVDGIDYSYFASRWGDVNCGDSNDCDGVDFDFSGDVDWGDFRIFCDHWLEGK